MFAHSARFPPLRSPIFDELDDETAGASPSSSSPPSSSSSRSGSPVGNEAKRPRLSALEEIRLEEERKKQRTEMLTRVDHWMSPGLVVKVMNRKLADGKYYKQKGVVVRMQDKYVGEIKMLDSGDVLRLDQEHCETVIPAVGGAVRFVNGPHRGEEATLRSIDFDKFNAALTISRGPKAGRVIEGVPYEDFCKIE